jgi:glyoxylase I family protein
MIPFRVAELDHIVIRCSDQSRALYFYTRVLGLTEERRVERIGLIQLRAGASMVDLVPAGETVGDNGRNVDHFCLGIASDNLADVIAYFRTLGIEVIGEPQARYGARGFGDSIYVRDPDGNVIELKQIPARATAQ